MSSVPELVDPNLSHGRNFLRLITMLIILLVYMLAGPLAWKLATGNPMHVSLFLVWMVFGYFKGFEYFLRLLRSIPLTCRLVRYGAGLS